MSVSMDLIKQLREETGAGISDCKNALIESQGDIDKARKILLAKGAAKAAKKLDRLTKEGVISIKNNGKKAIMIELGCETDFVGRNEKFVELAKNITEFLFDKDFSDVDEALNLEYKDSKDLRTFINENISVFGENIRLSRVKVLKAQKNSEIIFDYLHFNNRVGVLVLIDSEKELDEENKKELGNKVVFQIASMRPAYLDLSSIPNEEIEEQKKMAFEQAKNEGKPEHIAQKIAEGKVLKIFEESVLLEQPFFDDSMKLPKFKDYIKFMESKIGGSIVVKDFARFEIGK